MVKEGSQSAFFILQFPKEAYKYFSIRSFGCVIAITTVGECAVVVMEGEQILREMKRSDSLCEVTQDIKVHGSLLLVPRPSFNPPKRKGGSGEYSTAFLYLPQKFRGRI